MGLNLHIQRDNGKYWEDHPDWDSFRYAGDREVTRIIDDNGGRLPHPEAECFRPANLDALAEADWPDYNPDRWKQLVELLRDPQYWIYLSY